MKYYVLKPSLQHVALVKIATMLWDKNIRAASDWQFLLCPREEWQEMESKVINTLSKLPQPELLKEKISDFVKPIGQQVFKFLKHFFSHYNLENPENLLYLRTSICWTQQGTIDQKKTAELLIRDERIDIVIRYKLACNYCIVTDILALWRKIRNDSNHFFFHDKIHWTDELVRFFHYNLNQNSGPMYSNYQCEFLFAAMSCGKVATEYFLPKLTRQEIHNSLSLISQYIKDPEVICLLLSHINEEKQIHFLRNLSYKRTVMECFLDWPWQQFFLGIACHMCYSKEDFRLLLIYIAQKSIDGYKDYQYESIFREFWHYPPDDFRRYITDNVYTLSNLMKKLLQAKNVDNIKMIFEELNLSDRSELYFGSPEKSFCEDLMKTDQWALLKFFIRECVASKFKIVKLRMEFELELKLNLLSRKYNCGKLFEIIDECVTEQDKIKCAEENNSKTM